MTVSSISLKVLIVLSLLATSVAAGPTEEELVDAVLSRADAIQTAIIQFSYYFETTAIDPGLSSNSEHDNNVPGTKVGSDSGRTLTTTKILAYARPDYSITYPGSNFKIVNHDGLFATFTDRENPDKTRYQSCVLKSQEGSLEDGHRGEIWRRVLRCGTIPLPEMQEFIDQNRGAAKYGGSRTINGINNEVLEWDVLPRDYDSAFYYMPETFLAADRAILRLLVAPQLGYCVTGVEYVRADEQPMFWYEGQDFRPIAPDIYAPYAWSWTNLSGGVRVTCGFVIDSIALVNESPPADSFTLLLPEAGQSHVGVGSLE